MDSAKMDAALREFMMIDGLLMIGYLVGITIVLSVVGCLMCWGMLSLIFWIEDKIDMWKRRKSL